MFVFLAFVHVCCSCLDICCLCWVSHGKEQFEVNCKPAENFIPCGDYGQSKQPLP